MVGIEKFEYFTVSLGQGALEAPVVVNAAGAWASAVGAMAGAAPCACPPSPLRGAGLAPRALMCGPGPRCRPCERLLLKTRGRGAHGVPRTKRPSTLAPFPMTMIWRSASPGLRMRRS